MSARALSLTISVAAYNAGAYLERCLQSLASGSGGGLEVLVINDGSTDNTAAIAEAYAGKYPGVFSLVNKENGGHGSTINRGLLLAKGKYFKPVDADDWLESGTLSELVTSLAALDVDMVVTDVCEEYTQSGKTRINAGKPLPEARCKSFDRYSAKKMLTMHHIIYKTDMLRRNRIRVAEHVYYEDSEYVIYPMPFVKDFVYIPKTLYHYRLEREGQSVAEESTLKHKDDMMLVLRNLFAFYQSHAHSPRRAGLKRRISDVFNFYHERTCSKAWYAAGKEMRLETRAFYKELRALSPPLFAFCAARNKTLLLQLLTGFTLDAPIFTLRAAWRRLKARLRAA